MKCPHCRIGPMIDLGFGYYQCRLVDMPHIPKDLDSSMFNPLCVIARKLS